jgi:hypothetical protein
MSNTFEKITRSLVLALGVIIIASPAAFCAPLNSNSSSVALTATLAESLTISATPSAVSFPLISGGTATGSAPVAITTTWVLSGARASVTLTGWFANSAQALTNGGTVYIPSSEVLGQVTTGAPTAFTAFTQSPTGLGVAGASLVLFTNAITSTNYSANRTDNLNLEINLATQPQLPAGVYTGTLNLQAQAL